MTIYSPTNHKNNVHEIIGVCLQSLVLSPDKTHDVLRRHIIVQELVVKSNMRTAYLSRDDLYYKKIKQKNYASGALGGEARSF